jgi:hypothetical protein
MKKYTWEDFLAPALSSANTIRRGMAKLVISFNTRDGRQLPDLTEKQINAIKRRETDRKYNASAKGQARKARFLATERGQASAKESHSKYNRSKKGKARSNDYYLLHRNECLDRSRMYGLRKRNGVVVAADGTWVWPGETEEQARARKCVPNYESFILSDYLNKMKEGAE